MRRYPESVKQCTKVHYDQLGARLAIASLRRKRQGKRRECAMYYCRQCGCYHLTSHPRK
jgi:hypothetical protein